MAGEKRMLALKLPALIVGMTLLEARGMDAAAMSLVSVDALDPTGLGRVIRTEGGTVLLTGSVQDRPLIEQVRELQRNAMLDLINDAVVKDERLSLAAVGEIRAYETIASLYEDFVQTNVEKPDELA